MSFALDQHCIDTRTDGRTCKCGRSQRFERSRLFNIIEEGLEQAGAERQTLRCRIEHCCERGAIRQCRLTRALGGKAWQIATWQLGSTNRALLDQGFNARSDLLREFKNAFGIRRFDNQQIAHIRRTEGGTQATFTLHQILWYRSQ